MTAAEQLTVRPGQVWQSNDPREAPGRKVRVCMVDSRYAYLRQQDLNGGWTGRASRVQLSALRFAPARTGVPTR